MRGWRDLVRSGQAIGVSSNEMARRASLQQSAANLEASLNGDPRFAGLQIIQSPTEFRVVAKFKGRLPTKAEITSDAELQAVLEIRPSGKSRGELRSLQQRVQAAAKARKIRSMVFVDQIAEKVEVYVEDVDSFRQALTDLRISDEVVVKQETSFPEPVQTSVQVKGGQAITANIGNCTTGFAATSGTSKGFLTAGHCVISSMNTSAPTNAYATLNGVNFQHGSSVWNSTTDLAFMKYAYAVTTSVIWDGQFDRIMRSTATTLPSDGSSMCKYGRTTGYNCAPVYDNDAVSTDAAGNTVGPMVVLRGSPNAGLGAYGDSGGPVFYGSVAHGLTSRADSEWLWYTPVSRSSQISASVVVSP